MAKLRPDSAIASLNQDQRDHLYDLLCLHSYSEVIDLAAKPVNEGGFNLRFHKTSLIRFYEREQEERQAQELAELAASADGKALPDRVEKLLAAARVKLAQAAYELSKSASDPENFDRLDRALYHMEMTRYRREQLEVMKREVAIKEQQLALERERMAEQRRQWEYNASRAALNHLPDLLKIVRDKSIDNEDKIWAARNICFGNERAPSSSPGSAPVPGAQAGVSPGSSTQSDTLKHISGAGSAGAPPNSISSQLDNLQPENLQFASQTQSDTLKHIPTMGSAPVPGAESGVSPDLIS